MEPHRTARGVFTERKNIYTESRDPGKRVYGEHLIGVNGIEYREWMPSRSKLAAYLMCGGSVFPFEKDSKVLYLGAASGTTSSHVSDLAKNGKVFCVEFSSRPFRDLVKIAEGRDNMIPILGDATKPEEYAFAVERADIVYSDVAQKRQADILADNMERFGARYGFVSIKARSEDVTAKPEDVFEMARRHLKERGFRILELIDLSPFEKDHAMIAVEKPRTVYSVAVEDGKFMMVFNGKRNGWEMPGGKIEPGETTEEAARREFLEESGFEVEIIGKTNIGYCDVCACRLVRKVADGEMESKLFDELPDDLAFATDEYENVIGWAKNVCGKR